MDDRFISCYNPEDSQLRHDQLELFKMVQVVAEICKENNINWWLSSGTLLGAARHKGFIPWDDDMDIVLLKKDYIKLEKILCSIESDEYVFHCQKTDIDYVNYFGKFRKKEGRISSPSKRYDFYQWTGIGFDIFAIEKTNTVAAFVASKLYSRLQGKTIEINNSKKRHFVIRSIQFLCDYIFFPILRLIGLINPKSECHYLLGTGWPSHKFYYKDTFPLSTAEFEGKQMPVPKNMDAYLTNVYGNWRKIPSAEEIKSSIHCQQYRDEIYGKEQ